MKKKSQGETEAEFTRAMIQFERSYLGRGPEDVRTFFLNDLIIVRLRGVLTPAETKLSETPDGQALVKETRRRLFESSRPMIEQMVQDIVDCKVVSLHTDVSTTTHSPVRVLTVDTNLDERYKTPKI
jgi:uncharacterized protein YbcI